MQKIIAQLKSLQLVDILSYQTVKLVLIKDKRLGVIHYLLQLGIFIYIIVYTIIIKKQFLQIDVPHGSIRATVQEPINWALVENLPYCWQNQTSYKGNSNLNCSYMLGLDLTYPVGLMDSVFMSTQIKDTFYALSPPCDSSQLLTSSMCIPIKRESVRHSLAGIEEYTIYMEHAVTSNKKQIPLRICEGKLNFLNGARSQSLNNPTRPADILPIKTILDAANVSSLDAPSGLGGSLRSSGVLIVAMVSYANDLSGNIHYTYDMFTIDNLDVLTKAHSTPVSGGFTQRTWYGIRIIFLVGGKIGKFDFIILLSSLVSGLVLVKAATVVVDVMLCYVMPDKHIYTKHKFEVTEDFRDIRRERKRTLSTDQAETGDNNDVPNFVLTKGES